MHAHNKVLLSKCCIGKLREDGLATSAPFSRSFHHGTIAVPVDVDAALVMSAIADLRNV